MAFSSALLPNEPIVDDSRAVPYMPGMATGLILPPDRHQMTHAEAYSGVAEPFPDELIIPESEWEARIKEMEERKERISDKILAAGLPSKDQDSLSYCWIFGPTGCMEVIRLLQNQEYVPLSATSVGAVIKNFRNQGGWGKEGLQYIANKGVCTQKDWPECQLKQQYNTPEAWNEAKNYTAAEWWVLNDKSFNQIISCLLRRIPVAVGLDWWSHEVYYCDPVWLDGRIAVRFRNSWGDGYGSKGFAILQGSKMYPDDAVAPRVAGPAQSPVGAA